MRNYYSWDVWWLIYTNLNYKFGVWVLWWSNYNQTPRNRLIYWFFEEIRCSWFPFVPIKIWGDLEVLFSLTRYWIHGRRVHRLKFYNWNNRRKTVNGNKIIYIRFFFFFVSGEVLPRDLIRELFGTKVCQSSSEKSEGIASPVEVLFKFGIMNGASVLLSLILTLFDSELPVNAISVQIAVSVE